MQVSLVWGANCLLWFLLYFTHKGSSPYAFLKATLSMYFIEVSTWQEALNNIWTQNAILSTKPYNQTLSANMDEKLFSPEFGEFYPWDRGTWWESPLLNWIPPPDVKRCKKASLECVFWFSLLHHFHLLLGNPGLAARVLWKVTCVFSCDFPYYSKLTSSLWKQILWKKPRCSCWQKPLWEKWKKPQILESPH